MNVPSSQQIQLQGIRTNYKRLGTDAACFFPGFIAAGNSVFIPFFKHDFNLVGFQSALTDFASYGTYYLRALGFFAYGSFGGKDLAGKWGYNNAPSISV